MSLDVHSFLFHFGEYDKELKILLPQLSDVEYSAFVASCGKIITLNSSASSFMNSKTAAWEMMDLLRRIIRKDLPSGIEDLSLTTDSGLSGLHQAHGPPENPPL